jgi:hypothetical protein
VLVETHTLKVLTNAYTIPVITQRLLALFTAAAFEHQIKRLKLHENLYYFEMIEANGPNGPKRETDHKDK